MRYSVMYVYETKDASTARAAANAAWVAIEGAGGELWHAIPRLAPDDRYSERIPHWDGWQDDVDEDFRILRSED